MRALGAKAVKACSVGAQLLPKPYFDALKLWLL